MHIKNSRRVGVINYGSGNFSSVFNALESVGLTPVEIRQRTQLGDTSCLVLPGVGTFEQAMRKLKSMDIIESLAKEVVERKKPYLGICVGMQILATMGFEFTPCKGLGWVPGVVHRLSVPREFPLPHIGWNDIKLRGRHPLLAGITAEDASFYFVHGYHLIPEQPEVVLATCEYGAAFAAVVGSENVYGVQFHPEKSQDAGRKLLHNFIKIADAC